MRNFNVFNALKRFFAYTIPFILLLLVSNSISAYYFDLSGYVMDKDNQPLPFVNVFVKEAEVGITTDEKGKFHFELVQGTYEVIFSMIGYEEKRIQITLTKDVIRNVYMKESLQGIEQVEVVVKRRDPAYDIMKSAVAVKKRYLNQFESSRCNVYIKAGEIGENISKKKSKPEKEKSDSKKKQSKKEDKEPGDTTKPKKPTKILPQKSFVEVQLTKEWKAPNNIKETVSAYEKRGSDYYLYYTSTTDADFNFYKNLLNINGLTETPIISPLSVTGILAYRFKLLKSFMEGEKLTYRIKIIPRRMGNLLMDGTIDIVDGDWNIKRLSLHLGKGSTNLFDDFTVKQEFNKHDDSIWVLSNQELLYTTKSGKELYKGQTKAIFSDWEINPPFKKNYFSNELGVVTEEAFERDSSFWETIRPEPLTEEEQEFVAYSDSIRELKESEEYLDSMQALANKVTLRKLFIDGLAYVDYKKEKRLYFSSITGMVSPFDVGGFRVGYWMSYYKKFKKKRSIYVYGYPNYGFRNKDLKGSANMRWKYNPFREGYLSVRASREFDMINPYDAYINILKRNNWFQNDRFGFSNSIEIFNGLYSSFSTSFSYRTSISHYKIGNITDGLFDDNNFRDFELHNAFKTTIGLSYTPKQKYIRRPNEKIVLGSKWPTFGVKYRKGWDKLFHSSIDFDYLEFYMRQKIKLGLGGTSEFKIKSGKFLNQDSVPIIDYKFQRMGDPYIYTDPLTTFQMLGSTFPTFDWYLEGHYIHHFNGALVNKFPIIKKTRLRLVAGGSVLYAMENNYQHIEAFAGAERIVKIARERFRFGFYVATAESNQAPVEAAFKVSVEYFNRQSQGWGF